MTKPLKVEISITKLEEFKTICIAGMLATTALQFYADGEMDGGQVAREAIAQIKSELAAINFELEAFNSGVPGENTDEG